jgi:hypothetical protein
MSNPCSRDVILLKKLVLCEPRGRSSPLVVRILRHLKKKPFQQCGREQGATTSQQTLKDALNPSRAIASPFLRSSRVKRELVKDEQPPARKE